MKTIHNIALKIDEELQSRLADYDISVSLGFGAFKVNEADPNWPEIKSLLTGYKPVITSNSVFTAAELKRAELLELRPSWQHGYPEPSDDLGYLERTYSLDKFCSKCGIGKIQTAPFCMKGEPKWGKKHLLQLNWIGDEFFCQPSIWADYFKPFGLSRRPVLDSRTGDELSSVVQLDIPRLDIGLSEPDTLDSLTCECCGRKKFLPISTGFFPALEGTTNHPIFKIDAFFGSGARAYQPVILSESLYSSMNKGKLKGVEFRPLESH